MPVQSPNSKREIRDSKETRNAKFDNSGRYATAAPEASALWSWGDESTSGSHLLRDAPNDKPFDLLERTAIFGEAIIHFAKKLPPNPVNHRLIDQLVGAGTSIGANYCEANDAVSKKDFKNKIGICRKESKETMFFLRMAATAEENLRDEARALWREAKELNLIFGAIFRR